MKKFIGTKLVLALAMNRADYNTYRGWLLPEDEDGSDEGWLVEYIDGGQANDKRHKGYISWSPSEVFANSYRETEGMTFGLAIEAMKKGSKIARLGWNGADMYVTYVPTRTEENGGEDMFDRPYIHYREFMLLKTAQDDLAAWSPSGSDALAEDWFIVGEE